MSKSKLGLHVHQPSPEVDAIIRSAPWAAVKSLGNTQPLVTARDAGIPIRILRMYGVEALDPSSAVALWAGADLSMVTHVQLVCESTRGYDTGWQLSVINGLKARGYTGRFLVGGFATGNPEKNVADGPGWHFPELEPIYTLLKRPDVDLGLDAYSGILPSNAGWGEWAQWTGERPRLILADLARQGIDSHAIICESGGDNAQPALTGGGWLTRSWSPDEYLSLLTTLDQDDQQLEGVLARCIFTLNATPDWGNYEIQSISTQLAAYVTSKENSTMVTVQEVNQGPTRLCGYAAVQECVTAAGGKADMVNLYERVKGYSFVSPGDASSFGEIVKAVELAAQDSGLSISWAPGSVNGVINDFPSFEAGIKAGYLTIAGLAAQDIQAGQNYGHFIVCTQETYDPSGAPLIQDVDSYRDFDGFPKYIPLAQLEQAIRDNWDANAVSISFRLAPPIPTPQSSTLGGDELAAYNYYTQNGVHVDTSHAIWTSLLYPAWVRYNQMVQSGDKLADSFRFGPLTKGESGATWGPTKLPAAVVRLTNRGVGVHLGTDGTWDHPYQVEL